MKAMKKLNFLAVLIFTFCLCSGQNLVTNGDFEITGIVPCDWTTSAANFNAATSNWTSPTDATPDIHSTLVSQSCSNFHPNSTYTGCTNGSQIPHSGNIFGGFYTYVLGVVWREYLQAQLSSPMIPGAVYNIDLFISLGEKSQYATDVGVGFSTTATTLSISSELGYTPQKHFTNAITDSINWVHLHDTIIPDQAYEYIIIGNFFNDAGTNLVSVNPGTCWDRAYYYCDDVNISMDTTVSIAETEKNNSVVLYPNPINERLNARVNDKNVSEITLYDVTSRKLLQQKFSGFISLNTDQLLNGAYFVEIKNKKGIITRRKLVKQ